MCRLYIFSLFIIPNHEGICMEQDMYYIAKLVCKESTHPLLQTRMKIKLRISLSPPLEDHLKR